jgi:hypothetical protein
MILGVEKGPELYWLDPRSCSSAAGSTVGITSRLLFIPFHVRWAPYHHGMGVLGLRMEERPPAKEGNCEYI